MQMGAGIAAGPHCRRCWHSGIPAPELTASFRRSLPFGCRPFERPVLSNDAPPVRFAVQSFPRGGLFLLGSAFSPAASAVPDRMGLAVAGARAAFAALPRLLLLQACFLLSSVGAAPSGPAWLPRLQTVPPSGRQGPFRASWRAAPCSASAGACHRSCDHGPCRIRFAPGRQSGIRNRPFRFAIHPFQNAPQHAGTGFIAYFPVRSDRSIFTFKSVPCGSHSRLRFPLDNVDAAPRT